MIIDQKGGGYVNVEKIPKKKISELVVEQIEKMIESGMFKPGEKLPSMRELCEMFDVGRSAIRDAIITLNGKGTVNVKQGEGTYICEFDSTKFFNQTTLLPSQKNIRELFQVRKIVEAGIAEGAALNRTEEDVEIIGEILLNQTDGWESDYNFHMAIAHAAGNEILVQLMEFISSTTKKTMNEFYAQIEPNDEILASIKAQHNNIYKSIQSGESKLAYQIMIKHLSFVEELLQDRVLIDKAHETM